MNAADDVHLKTVTSIKDDFIYTMSTYTLHLKVLTAFDILNSC